MDIFESLARQAIENGIDDSWLDRARSAVHMVSIAPRPGTCTWSLVPWADGNTWEGECGAMWELTDGTPLENSMSFCPGCGGVLAEGAYCEIEEVA